MKTLARHVSGVHLLLSEGSCLVCPSGAGGFVAAAAAGVAM